MSQIARQKFVQNIFNDFNEEVINQITYVIQCKYAMQLYL